MRPVRRRSAASAAALVLGTAAGTLSADPVDSALGLGDWRMDIARLTTESLSGEATFLVDDCGMINVKIVSDISGLTTRISAPGGQPVIDPASVRQLGGAYRLASSAEFVGRKRAQETSRTAFPAGFRCFWQTGRGLSFGREFAV